MIFDVIFTAFKTEKNLNAYLSMEDTPSWSSMFCTCFETFDHGHGVLDELQHDMSPCPDIVRVYVFSLKIHERLSPHLPDFSSRIAFLSSMWSLFVCLPPKGMLEVSSFAIAPTVIAIINAKVMIFMVLFRRKSMKK